MKLAYTQKIGPWGALRVGPYYPNLKAWVDADGLSKALPDVTWSYLLAVQGATYVGERGKRNMALSFEGSQQDLVQYLRQRRDDSRKRAMGLISSRAQSRSFGEADGIEIACQVIENWNETDG